MANYLWIDVITAWTAGLLGSIHCIAMCGPIAGYGCGVGSTRRVWGGPLWFVSGKLISYALVGLLVGTVGALLLSMQWVPRFGAWITIVSGGLMVILIAYHWLTPAKSNEHWSLRLLRPVISLSKVNRESSTLFHKYRVPFLLGFCAALLPCGLLHAMMFRAAATGSALYSMLLMVAFGMGTSPALVGIASVSLLLPSVLRKHANRLGEGMLVIVAVVMIVRGIYGLVSPEECILCK